MLKKSIPFLLLGLFAISCQQNSAEDPFLITNNKIGLLTHQTKVSQLDSIYKNDSIVKLSKNDRLLSSSNEIEVYEKGGAKLLVLEPYASGNDATIKNIQIIDGRYHTSAGLSSSSTFKDIKDNYTISKINNTLSTAVIFVDSIQAYITVDKKELSNELRSNTTASIKVSDIPDLAKIKHFWVSWDKN